MKFISWDCDEQLGDTLLVEFDPEEENGEIVIRMGESTLHISGSEKASRTIVLWGSEANEYAEVFEEEMEDGIVHVSVR